LSPGMTTKDGFLCSVKTKTHNLASIIGLALQHDGGPFGLSKKTTSVLD